jgi:hypothetical protein
MPLVAHPLSSLSLYHVDTNVSIDYNSIVTFLEEALMRELKQKNLEKQFANVDQWYRDEPDRFTGFSPEDLKEMFEAEAWGVSVELVQLKDFLNYEYTWGLATTGRGLTDEETNELRAEIIQDISPIVSPSNGGEVLAALEKLINKINSMRLHPPWTVYEKPDKKQWIQREGPLAGMELEYTGPEGPIMLIGGKKLIVCHRLGTRTFSGSRASFYSVIIKTLEDRTFQKLKRCKECQRFFIADRLSDKFCRPECSKAHFDLGAADRVKRSREQKKKQSKKRSSAKVKRKRRK